MSQQFIPLSVPNFSGNEKQYVNEAVISEWVSTGGSKVSEFEEKIAEVASKVEMGKKLAESLAEVDPEFRVFTRDFVQIVSA